MSFDAHWYFSILSVAPCFVQTTSLVNLSVGLLVCRYLDMFLDHILSPKMTWLHPHPTPLSLSLPMTSCHLLFVPKLCKWHFYVFEICDHRSPHLFLQNPVAAIGNLFSYLANLTLGSRGDKCPKWKLSYGGFCGGKMSKKGPKTKYMGVYLGDWKPNFFPVIRCRPVKS